MLLLERGRDAAFVPGAFVFPGGVVEDADHHLAAACEGIDDPAASARLGLPAGGLAYWVAAIRECFEEAGLLFGLGRHGTFVNEPGWRALPFPELVRREAITLATDRLHYIAHWITPVGAPRRFDTRFFLAVAPPAQTAAHDERELVSHRWVTPEEAIGQAVSGALPLRTPTRTTLAGLVGTGSTAELLARLKARREVPTILPVVSSDGRRLLPGDAGYEDHVRGGGPR